MQDRFQRLEKIGEGSCGVVFKCRDKTDGGVVAVKKINFTYDCEGGAPFGVPAAALREVALLRALGGHPNVVALREAFMEADRMFLVCDFVDCDLRRHLDSLGRLHPMRAKLYAWQVFHALAHCHAHRVAHRDVKPHNLLVEVATDTIKLCDFSLSCSVIAPNGNQTRRVASLWYRSPEILLGGDAQGVPLDCWSAGCVLGELVSDSPVFPGASEIETIFLQFRKLGTPTERSWPGCTKLQHWSEKFPLFAPEEGPIAGAPPGCAPLLAGLLRCDPALRVSMQRALCHTYFADLDITTRVGKVARELLPSGVVGKHASGAADGGAVAKRQRLPGDRMLQIA